MNFSAYSIKNPLVAILLFTVLTLLGLFAFGQMKVQKFPDIDFPSVVVSVAVPGASPAHLENDVAKKVENKLAGIEGIKRIRTVVQTGVVTVHSQFQLHKDPSDAVDDVRTAIGEIRSQLPAAAKEPIIAKVTLAGFPVVGYSVSAKDMTPAQLSWWVDDTLNRKLATLEGVGAIERIGGVERQIVVEADANRLGAWQMPITALARQVATLWTDAPGGSAKVGGGTQSIRVLGTGNRLDDLKKLPINTPAGTATLEQIAKVSDRTATPTSEAWLNGESVVALQISRARGASEVAMVRQLDQALADLVLTMPGLSITKIYDNAAPVNEDYHASLRMLLEGCLLAVLVVWIFLRNGRATLVTAIALPLSVIPTFWAMHALGFSLNIISLLALSLVVGVLVDDAIVEVENIMRHLRMGKTPYQAAMEAADEIGLAVIATTLALIAVFLPTAFMGGVVGQFFRQFGFTASLAIFMSLLVARLITPMMAAYLLKSEPLKTTQTSPLMARYLRVVGWTLGHRGVTLALALAFFVGSLCLSKFLPTAFIPADDINQTQVTLTLTPDSTLQDTVRVAQQASALIEDIDGVQAVFLAAGVTGGGMDKSATGADAVNRATLNIGLAPRDRRKSKSAIENDIRQALHGVAGAKFRVGLSAGGGSGGYSFSLMGDNAQLLSQSASRLVQELSALPGLSVSSNAPLPKPELTVQPKRLLMAERGVTTSAVADVLRVATVGDYAQNLPKINFDTRQIPVIVRLPDIDREQLSALTQLYVPAAGKNSVQIGTVADLRLGVGDSEIHRLNRQREIKITVDGALPLGELKRQVKNSTAVTSLPAAITVAEEGDAENMKELFGGFVLAMTAGIVSIFMVLMLLFRRVLQPFSILMALPLAVGGAFVGLLLTGNELSMPSMIGLIMLMGIASKNSILLVDYAIVAQDAGQNQRMAVLSACQKRARPIVMTSVAMAAGMMPLLFGIGDVDSTFRQPMAAAVLGGLLTSTLLSLVVIPVVYTLMDDLGRFVSHKRQSVQISK